MTTPESVLAPQELGREPQRAARQPLTRTGLQFVRSNWVPVGGMALALIGWGVTGASPIHALNEVAYQQEQRESQRELVKRHIALGNDFLNLGQLDAAQEEFTQASTLDPYDAEARFGLLKASVFKPIRDKEYDPEIAERRLHAVLSERPGDTHALVYLGNVYYGSDRDTAMWYYDRALASDSANASAYFGKGVVYDEGKRADEALAMYERASALSPWNQVFLNNLGYQYYLRGNYAKAESLYIRLLRLESNFLLSGYMLANAQLMMGSPELAYRNLQLWEDALRDTLTLSLPRNRGGWLFHVGGASPERLYGAHEKAAYGHYLMAMAAYLSNDEQSAQRHLREIVQLRVRWPQPVETIVWADLRTLRRASSAMRARVDRLERMIWPSGFRWPLPTPPAPEH